MIGLTHLKVGAFCISKVAAYNIFAGFIKQMERNSSVKFSEAQVALARQWVAGDMLTTQKEIILSLPREEEGLETNTEKGKEKDKTIKVPIPVDDEAARHVVINFQNGAQGVRSDESVADNVAQHRLQDKTSLLDEKWLGTEEEELNAWVFRVSFCVGWFSLIVRFLSYVSELVYIHSKVMIVDDRRVIVTLFLFFVSPILPVIDT
jgi:phospholipase D1/2